MSSTTGRRYLRLLCGGTWGLSGEEGSGVLTQASRFPWACGWPWGRAGGLSERIPPSLGCPCASLSSSGLSWVCPGSARCAGPWLPGREAAAGTRPLTGGTLSGLAVLPSNGGQPAAGFPEMPTTRSPPGRSESCSHLHWLPVEKGVLASALWAASLHLHRSPSAATEQFGHLLGPPPPRLFPHVTALLGLARW